MGGALPWAYPRWGGIRIVTWGPLELREWITWLK